MLSLIPEHGEHLLAVVIIGNAILKWVGEWVGGGNIFIYGEKKKNINNVVNTSKNVDLNRSVNSKYSNHQRLSRQNYDSGQHFKNV